jgi:hypothetical protein
MDIENKEFKVDANEIIQLLLQRIADLNLQLAIAQAAKKTKEDKKKVEKNVQPSK